VEGDLKDLSAVVDGLQLDRFVLFAAFGRTHTAAHYAVRHPERVRALVLQGVIMSGANGLNVSGAPLARRDWDFFLRSQVQTGMPLALAKQSLAYLRGSMTQADWLQSIETFAKSELGEVLGHVRRPTLLLHPRVTPYATEQDSAAAAAAIPGARLVEIDGPGYPAGSPTAALEAIEAFLRDMPAAGRRLAGGTGSLSPREIEVLRLVAEGKSNREIAEALVLSERTVINHLSNIFTKTGAENRAGAAALALRHGLV
jgi:DNA-binding CsgD family transcriptional regulator/pimeloyl-ACP methyl ester carboxylesterase